MATRTTRSNRSVTISRWRINTMLMIAVLVVSRVVIQLGNIQVVQHQKLADRARYEIDQTKTIQPQRGTIRDRMGNILALDVERESLYVTPGLVNQEQAPKLALILSGLLGLPAPDIQAKLQDTEHYWLAIARWLQPEVAERIAALKEPGLNLIYEPRRFYPQGEYAAQTIGVANYEGVGISGVEGFYDSALKGITGTITAEWDPSGNPIWINPPQTKYASDGADLELTLDPLIQHVIETELKKGSKSTRLRAVQ